MKVSLNLAQEFSNVDLKSIPRDELLQRIGAQLGAVEDTVDWARRFEGAVIVKVAECIKHENADKLSVCRIDDGGQNQSVERGEDGLIQVVCGAPNVHADMFAIWLAPGVTVPSTLDTAPFLLEAREIRGVVSNGMLASASELGISDDHSGIVDVTAEDAGRQPVAGEPLINYFGLDDFVIDCENKMFTHRPDCFGNLGVARELAAISGYKFEDPEWYWQKQQFESRQDVRLDIKNNASELVPRFMAVAMKDVMVKPSPFWLQATLARVGIKPINNIVDVTNYVMHLTGQPTHAYDADKLRKVAGQESGVASLETRMSREGDRLLLLGGKSINFQDNQDILITSNDVPVGLGGVMGGADTEVDENTKNIIIECATFDMYAIRRTSMRFGLFTDAVTRFNKGQSPLQNDRVLAFLMKKMGEIAGAEQASEVYDLKAGYEQAHLDQSLNGFMQVEAGFINERLGSDLSNEKICELLRRVHFAAYEEDGKLEITAPFWRMDIEIPEDIVEEVGRLYGYDKLPIELPKRYAAPTPKNQLFEYKHQLRNKLKQAGANEVLTYSFVNGELLKKSDIEAEKWSYHIRNAISPDLQYYRPSLLPSLLAKVHPNIKAQAGSENNQFALHEIGKAHIRGQEADGLPEQLERVALVVAADDKTAKHKQAGAAYYLVRKYIDLITNNQAQYHPFENQDQPIGLPFAEARSAQVILHGQDIGVVGEFKPSVRSSLKLPDFTAGFELDLTLLMNLVKPNQYKPLPPLPGTHQDYTQVVGKNINWVAVRDGLVQALDTVNTHGLEISLEPLDIFMSEDSSEKRITFRIHMHHPHRTLKTNEVTALIDEAAKILNQKFEIQEA